MLVFCLPTSPRAALTAMTICALLLLGGCGGSGGSGPHTGSTITVPDQWPGVDGTLSTVRAGCDVRSGETVPGGHFTFALNEEVEPEHAPVPHNRAERVVFAQLYETLVTVACDGTVSPGLAEHWTCTEDSTTWVFTLRDGARFWDGTRITAETVRQAWQDNQSDPGCENTPSPWSWINARASSINAVDARRLAIQLPEPQARFPLLLAHPAAAVAIRQPGWTWPVGSGAARLRASDPAPRPHLELRPNLNHPDCPVWKSLVFNIKPGLDLRDLVTTETNLTLARDLETVRFFNEAPGFEPVPLPWDRLYLLVCPPQTNPVGPERWTAAIARLQVARDMTGISAQAWSHIMFPLGDTKRCPQLSGPITGQRSVPVSSDLASHRLDDMTIGYAADAPGAAELAGRLSHLAGPDARIAGLSGMDLNLAVQWQIAGAFVIAQDQLFPTGCLQLASLMGQAAWLQKAGLGQPDRVPGENLVQAQNQSAGPTRSPADALVAAGIVHPLALSRSWLIVRGELAGLSLSFDGTPLLHGIGRPVAPTAERATQ